MIHNISESIPKNNKTPGVVFYSVSGKPFYVDVLHALNLGTQGKLEEILAIESCEEFDYQINKLCLSPIMRKTYTLYGACLEKNIESSHKKGPVHYLKDLSLYSYYYIISPKLVPLQLRYPGFNKTLYKIVDTSADILLAILNKKVLSEDEIFEIKKIGAKRKMTHATEKVKQDYAEYAANQIKTDVFLRKFQKE